MLLLRTNSLTPPALRYDGGHLLAAIQAAEKGLDERVAAHLCRQIASATAHLHRHGLAHRDLKLENFMLEGWYKWSGATHARAAVDDVPPRPPPLIKLVDFSLATFTGDERGARMHSSVGSPTYAAPEVLAARASDSGYTAACDIWSMGVCFFCLLHGRPPYERRDPQETMRAVLTEPLVFPPALEARLSMQAIDFVSWHLQKNPLERPLPEQTTGHPWLKHSSELRLPRDSDASSTVAVAGFCRPRVRSRDSSTNSEKQSRLPARADSAVPRKEAVTSPVEKPKPTPTPGTWPCSPVSMSPPGSPPTQELQQRLARGSMQREPLSSVILRAERDE